MLKFILSSIILLILPMILGMSIERTLIDRKGLYRVAFSYVTGFLLVLALFEIVCVPMIYLNCNLSKISIVYTAILIVLVLGSFVMNRRRIVAFFMNIKKKNYYIFHKLNVYSMIYILFFVVLFIVQIYYAINYSSTYNSYDDASYIVYGTDALKDTPVYGINPYSGVYGPEPFHRILQSSNIFYAYISKVTGVSLATVAHTIINVVLLIIAYCVYYMMAVDLLGKNKCHSENVWIFLDFVAMLYIFGYYSHSALSFRLLGVLWQGKAVLAVIVTPFLFVLMKEFLVQEYRHRYGLYLLMISIASISLSLMALSHILLGIGLSTVIVTCINKKWKNMLYILWAGVVPGIVGAVYLVERIMLL